MEQIPPRERIFGKENEYVPFDPNGDGDVSRFWLASKPRLYMNPFDGIVTNGSYKHAPQSSNFFLSNGGRFYKDLSYITEFAGPECLGPRQATVYDIASHHFISRATSRHVALANELEPKRQAKVRIHNRVVDYDEGHPKGKHENYYTQINPNKPPSNEIAYIAEHLAGFLIGRTIFNGAGMVKDIDGVGPRVVPGQKAQYVTYAIASTTSQTGRPWVSNRDQAHIGPIKSHTRIQVCGGDTNMSPYADFFTNTSTSIALRLIENDILPKFKVVEIHKATRAAANDYDGTAMINVEVGENHKKWKTIDLIDHYVDLAERHEHRGILSEQESAFLPQIRQDIDQFRADGPVSLNRAADWMTKQIFMDERGIEKFGKMKLYDLLFDMLVSDGIILDGEKKISLTDNHRIGWRLREAGYYRPLPDPIAPEEVEHAVFHAPRETRAGHREDLINLVPVLDKKLAIDWDYVSYEYKTERLRVALSDPYGSMDDDAKTNFSSIHKLAAKEAILKAKAAMHPGKLAEKEVA